MQPEPRVGRLSIISVAVAAVLIFGTVSARATTYYVSQSGNDSWTGTSDSEPWQTLTKASTITYGAGDQILLKCGDTWNEELHPGGSGTPSSPIVIGSYGAGDKPIIDRLDYNQDRIGVHLADQAGYTIAGIEFNRCMTGIYAEYSDGAPTREFIRIEDCDFRDSLKYDHYETYPTPRNIGLGVCLFSHERGNNIVLTDITIKNCTFRRLASGVWTNNPDNFNKDASYIYNFGNMNFEDCLFEEGYQWQMGIRGVDTGAVRNCVTHDIGRLDNFLAWNGVAGGMFFRSKNWVFEDSEWGFISTGGGSWDGEAFDFEGNCDNMTMKNCLFHDTDGPGFLLCCYASDGHPNMGIVMEDCVLNGKSMQPMAGMPRCEILNTTDWNEVTWDGSRFYLSPGEVLMHVQDPEEDKRTTFVDCVVKNLSDACSTPNRAATATPSASSQGTGSEADNAIDGNDATFWEATSATDQWLELDLGTPTAVSEFKIKEDASSSIVRYTIEYWDAEKSEWVSCFNGRTVGADFMAPIVTRTMQRVRLSIVGTTSGLPRIGEFGVYTLPVASAGTCTWDEGGDDKSWNTAANWSGDATPTSGTECVLDDNVVAMTASYGLDADFTIYNLTLNAADMTDLDANTSGTTDRVLTLNSTGANLIVVGSSANAAVNIGATPGVGSLGITLAGSGAIDVAGGKTLTIKSAIGESGTQSLAKTGAGTLTLSGANTYTGTTTVSAGTLQLGTGTTGQNGSVAGTSIVNNAALTFNNADAQAYSGDISGTGSLTKIGAGTLTLTGSSSIGGGARINGGTMTISGGGTLANGTANIGYDVADTGAVTVAGDGSQWSINNTLHVGRDGSNNSLTVSAGGVVNPSSTLIIGTNTNSNNNTVTVTGSGSSLYAGDWFMVGRKGSGNTLNIENGASVSCYLFWTSGGSGNPGGASNSIVTVTGAGSTFNAEWGDIGDRGTGNEFNVLNGATATMAGGDNYFGYWSSGNTITVDATNSVMNVSNLNTAWAAGGNNNTITVSNGGRINASGGGIKLLATGNSVDLNSGGELNITTLNLSTASSRLNFDGGRLIAQSTGSLITGSGRINLIGPGTISTDYDRTIANVIYGAGSLTKEGTGVLTLNAANTYSGDTNVSAGTLKLTTAGNNNIPNSAKIIVGGGATLDVSTVTGAGGFQVVSGQTLGGTGAINGDVTINSGGTLAPGASIGTLYADGDVILGAGAAYEWEVNNLDGTAGIDWDLLDINGCSLTVSATSGDPFGIKVISLDSLGDPGAAGGTLEAGDSFEIVAEAAAIAGFSTEAFAIDTTAFANPMAGLEFVVAARTGSLYLDVLAPPLWDADTGAADAQDGDGTWSDGGGNWWNGPGNVAWDNTKGKIATFGAGNATADLTVTVDAVTAGGIVFNDANGYRYTLTGGSITLEGAPTIEANVAATQVIAADVVLADALDIDVAELGTLVFEGLLDNSAGQTITKTGDGTLVINGPQDHAPATVFEILGGTVDLNTAAGGAGTANLSVLVDDAVLHFGCNQYLDTLTLQNGALVRFTGANVVVLNHLVMNGIDLGGVTLTPEPATLALVAAGLAALVVRKRRT